MSNQKSGTSRGSHFIADLIFVSPDLVIMRKFILVWTILWSLLRMARQSRKPSPKQLIEHWSSCRIKPCTSKYRVRTVGSVWNIQCRPITLRWCPRRCSISIVNWWSTLSSSMAMKRRHRSFIPWTIESTPHLSWREVRRDHRWFLRVHGLCAIGRSDRGKVVAFGVGSRCSSPETVDEDGGALLDCHALALARRALLRYVLFDSSPIRARQSRGATVFLTSNRQSSCLDISTSNYMPWPMVYLPCAIFSSILLVESYNWAATSPFISFFLMPRTVMRENFFQWTPTITWMPTMR